MTGYSAGTIEELPHPVGRLRPARAGGTRHHSIRRQHHGPAARLFDQGSRRARVGQQELYVALRGAGSVIVADTRHALDADHLVRVDAGTARVLSSGPEGLRVLCVGAVPGGVYEPPEWSSAD